MLSLTAPEDAEMTKPLPDPGRPGTLLPAAVALLALCALVLSLASPARAAFHFAAISELMTGLDGSDAVQFVEIEMLFAGQQFVGASKLSAFDSNGNFSHVVLTVPSNVMSGAGRKWIMATPAFAAAAGITPDFFFSSGVGIGMIGEDAMVCWGKPIDVTNPNGYIDCVSYGAYAGPANLQTSAPLAFSPYGRSALRTSDTNSSVNDFICNDPASPENNSFAVGSIAASAGCPVCGNGVLEVGEQCDGSADSACPGTCVTSCVCGNDCGNDALEGAEICDGIDDAACPGLCQVNCSCGPGVSLGKVDQKCANGFTKTSAASVASYGKVAVRCVKAFSRGKTSDEPAVCVDADPKGKLAKTAAKVDAAIDKACSAPYAVDCVAPCEATDAEGLSPAVDDDDELKACLRCMNKAVSWSGSEALAQKGVHGAILDGVTLATSGNDSFLAKCHASLVKGYEKLFSTQIKEQVACLKAELKAGSVPPVADACIGADPKGKVAKALEKLASATLKCPSLGVFDGGECGGLGEAALATCLGRVTTCKACLWGTTVLGESTVDCDLVDNGIADATCN